MGIKWEDIHIGNSLLSNSIFIGKSKPIKDNPKISEWTDRSNDMSDECINAVHHKLKQEQLERKNEKPYCDESYEHDNAHYD